MKIGFIGIGLMGRPMSINICKKSGQDVIVFDLDRSKAEEVAKFGAKIASSAKQVGEDCDVVITMVPKSEHVVAVYNELLPVAGKGQIFIDMSTISPDVSRQIAQKVKERSAVMLDAPVVKSVPAAEAGALGIYVGGCKETFNKVKDILGCMGNNIIHLGDNGSGLVMKLCHNTLVSQIQNGVNEMIGLAAKKGISVQDFITSVSYGGAQNFYLDTKGKAIESMNFATAFSVENMYKDVTLTSEMVNAAGMALPGVELVKTVYTKAMDEGFAKEDFSATYKVVNGIR